MSLQNNESIAEDGYDSLDFLQNFTTEQKIYIRTCVNKACEGLTRSSAHFTMRRLKDQIDKVIISGTEEPELPYKMPYTPENFKRLNQLQKKEYLEKKEKADKKREFVSSILEKVESNELVDYYVRSELDLYEIGDTNQFTTKDIRKTEEEMVDLGRAIDPTHCLDEIVVSNAIEERVGISEEQTIATLSCTRSENRISIVEGTAGAGKSFTMKAVMTAYINSGYKVMGTALSWNAAAVLSASTGIHDCTAIEGLVKAMEKAEKEGGDFFKQKTLLIVDEAGLVGSKHMHSLLKLTQNAKHPVKIVLTGDSLQLNPVDAGAALKLLVQELGTVRIDTIRRQKQLTHREAVKHFSFRKSGIALNTFMQQEAFTWSNDREQMFKAVMRDFLSYKAANPNKKPLILALANKDVSELNRMVRTAYKKMGLVYGMETPGILVTDGREKWKTTFAIGDEVVVRANSKDTPVYEIPPEKYDTNLKKWKAKEKVGVFNRNSGKIVDIIKSKSPLGSYDLVIQMEGDISGRIIMNTKNFVHENMSAFPIVHNFATTIYASQGQTVNAVFMLDSPRIDFRLAYVGASRHTEILKMYFNKEELHTRLDKKMKKGDPVELLKESQEMGKRLRPTELPVKQDRYSKSEMLGAVAAEWGKNSLNDTSISFEKSFNENRFKKSDNDDKELFELKGDPDNPNVVDFDTNRYTVEKGDNWQTIAEKQGIISLPIKNQEDVDKLVQWVANVKKWSNFEEEWELEQGDILFMQERINVKDKIIDLNALFKMEEIKQDVTVGLADIERNYKENDSPNIVIDEEKRHKHEEKVEKSLFKKNSLFSKLISSVIPKEDSEFKQRLSDYDAVEGSDINLTEEEEKEYMTLAKKHIKPEVKIPFIEEKPPIAYINRKGLLTFTDNNVKLQVSDDFIAQSKGIFWGEGRGYEPRIFATDGDQITSRYDLEGNCLVGQGFPPTLLVEEPEKSPFHIVPGAREAMLTYSFYLSKFGLDDPSKTPSVIWGAKGVDWSLFFKDHPEVSKKMIIVRGKNDDQEKIEWAKNIQEKIWRDHQLQIPIAPVIEGYIPLWQREEGLKNNVRKPSSFKPR